MKKLAEYFFGIILIAFMTMLVVTLLLTFIVSLFFGATNDTGNFILFVIGMTVGIYCLAQFGVPGADRIFSLMKKGCSSIGRALRSDRRS